MLPPSSQVLARTVAESRFTDGSLQIFARGTRKDGMLVPGEGPRRRAQAMVGSTSAQSPCRTFLSHASGALPS